MLAPALLILVLLGNERPPGKPVQKICRDGRTAKEIYLQAYVLKDTQPAEATKLWKQVLACTDPENEYHQKAKARLEMLADAPDAGR